MLTSQALLTSFCGCVVSGNLSPAVPGVWVRGWCCPRAILIPSGPGRSQKNCSHHRGLAPCPSRILPDPRLCLGHGGWDLSPL